MVMKSRSSLGKQTLLYTKYFVLNVYYACRGFPLGAGEGRTLQAVCGQADISITDTFSVLLIIVLSYYYYYNPSSQILSFQCSASAVADSHPSLCLPFSSSFSKFVFLPNSHLSLKCQPAQLLFVILSSISLVVYPSIHSSAHLGGGHPVDSKYL